MIWSPSSRRRQSGYGASATHPSPAYGPKPSADGPIKGERETIDDNVCFSKRIKLKNIK
jgi:hypothetical protein